MKNLCFLLLAFAIAACSQKKVSVSPQQLETVKPLTKNITVYNNGFPSNTAYDLRYLRMDSVKKEKPDIVLLMIGTNDATIANAVLPSYAENLSYMIDQFKKDGAQVVLMSPLPMLPGCIYYEHIHTLDSLATVMYQVSISKGCSYIDLHSYLSQAIKNSTSGGADLFLTDNLHPNATGYDLMAEYISKYIKSMKDLPVNSLTIACFGDSITYGILVDGAGTANGATYPAKLKKYLTE